MKYNMHRRATVGFRAIAMASVFLALLGCTSMPPRGSPVGSPGFTVRVLNASVTQVKEAPNPVSDAEVSNARAALRDASAWGAEYYEPGMYARAQAVLTAALAAREREPARCRSLLAEATEAASSARQAALADYEEDVKNRFKTSRADLVEIGAERAFPEEFARLVSGIDATVGLFAAGSYQDARFSAYTTLKGMSDLAEMVRNLSSWLKDAKIRVENAMNAAQASGAPQWAPGEMKNAEQRYHDAVTQMQAGDLKAAVESMKAAAQIALRLRLLQDKMDRREAGVPQESPPRASVPIASGPQAGVPLASVSLASRPALPERDKEISGPVPGVQPPPASVSSLSQRVRIANMSMSSLGAPQKLYSAFSAAVARFDVVAAEGLRDMGIMEKVLSGMNDGWEAAVSRSGYFGFIFNDRIQLVKDLGTYPGKGEFLHTPYAAQFKLEGTRFAVNLVLCHIETSKDRGFSAAETARLASVYNYYEKLTGNRGITLLLVGGLSEVPQRVSESLMPRGEMVSLRTNQAAAESSRDQGQRMFASDALQVLVEESGSGGSVPPFSYVILKTGKGAVP